MQVAKKPLTKEPYFTARSIEGVKDRLQSFQQLTDPPLDLDTILQKSKLLRGTPANHAQMAQWLRTNLQLSEEDLRRYLSKSPGILEKSPVGSLSQDAHKSHCCNLSLATAPLAALFAI